MPTKRTTTKRTTKTRSKIHGPRRAVSCRRPRAGVGAGLDWFVFFLADAQMGFGPLVAVYLTTQKWTQGDIGLVLTAGGLVALAGQMPGGALVDAARSERVLAAFSVLAIGASALMIGAWPIFAVVLAAKLLHSAASCILGPAIAAISLGLVGHAAMAERLGRNARFASIGAGLAAAGMGTAGYLISNQAVFFVTAALCVPTLVALWLIGAGQIDPERAHGGKAASHPGDPMATIRMLVRNRPLMIFAGCVALFHLANAAMLPLTASVMTMRSSDWAMALVGACMLAPSWWWQRLRHGSDERRPEADADRCFCSASQRCRSVASYLRSQVAPTCSSPCRSSTASPPQRSP